MSLVQQLFDFMIGKPWTLFVSSIVWYFFNRRKKKRELKALNEQLLLARATVSQLQEQIDDLEASPDIDEDSDTDEKKEIRIFMDGAFDIMHFGHMNAFRQGRALGTHLVVGINSDESITRCKGTAPVMKDEERCTAVQGCRFVDEIVPNVPYVMTSEYLEWVVKEYKIDYVVHGDDPCIVDGKDVYASAKERGMYRSVARTEGVSTSDIVGRMLLLTKDHHDKYVADGLPGRLSDASVEALAPFKRDSKYIPTSRMIRLFSAGIKDPPKEATVIYMDGAWDMFHAGHIEVLKEAKKLTENSYLIVGVHNDELVNNHRGSNFPTMNLHERVLSVLGCRYVDDVVIDAPWYVLFFCCLTNPSTSPNPNPTSSSHVRKEYVLHLVLNCTISLPPLLVLIQIPDSIHCHPTTYIYIYIYASGR
jgi:ethanolamine-phosphate cytidylyltransferase